MNPLSHDFLMEKKLHALDPVLHQRFTSAVFALQNTLSHYRRLFPEYTDHSEMHSMSVINFCNALIGSEQIERLNADEIYILLMSCYLHDIGMGISKRDYELFKHELHSDDYFDTHPNADICGFVRTYHHEFSALFIRKYADLLDIPTDGHLFSIIQVSRGHRRTNLFDINEYPADFPLENGNTVCLPYLAALIRLADEIDVASDRNSRLLWDIEALTDVDQIYFNRRLEAIPMLHMNPEGFMMDVRTDDETIYAGICEMRSTMQETLDLCRSVTHERTPYRITQSKIDMRRI